MRTKSGAHVRVGLLFHRYGGLDIHRSEPNRRISNTGNIAVVQVDATCSAAVSTWKERMPARENSGQ